MTYTLFFLSIGVITEVCRLCGGCRGAQSCTETAAANALLSQFCVGKLCTCRKTCLISRSSHILSQYEQDYSHTTCIKWHPGKNERRMSMYVCLNKSRKYRNTENVQESMSLLLNSFSSVFLETSVGSSCGDGVCKAEIKMHGAYLLSVTV